MAADHSLEVRLRSRPSREPTPDNFAIETATLAEPGAGEVRVRNLWMTVDPYMRPRMTDRPSYIPPFELGAVLEGGAIGEVVRSNDGRFRPGDHVQSMMGWRQAFNAPADRLEKVDADGIPLEAYLGVAGMPGLTAYIGITEIAKVGAGDVVFVSAAAGAVGSIACQIAKLRGARVIGSAGGAEKCAYLRELGLDQVIDYKAARDLRAELRNAAPDGLDVYFDNVGGSHLDAALHAAKPFARFAICGMISRYNEGESAPLDLIEIVLKRLRVQGFLVLDHPDLRSHFIGELKGWIEARQVTWRQTVEHGIERAPAAFMKLFSGENVGKMLVKLA